MRFQHKEPFFQDDNTLVAMLSSDVNGSDNNSLTSPLLTKNNHVTSSTPYSESKIRLPLINKHSNLAKSASTSDIPLVTKTQLDSTTMSESEFIKVL